MKATDMAEPATTAASAAVAVKYGMALGLGVLGALIMAAFDPPSTKKELFQQAACAGVGSAVFGPLAIEVASHFITFIDFANITGAIPVLFLTGALSWGAFGAIAKFRKIVRDRAAEALAGKVGLPSDPESK